MNDRQEKKVDDLLKGLHELIPQVADNKAGVNYLRSSTKRLEVDQGRHEERMENSECDLDSLGKKVREHIGQASIHEPIPAKDAFTNATVRWKFIAAVGAGLTAFIGLAGFIAGLIKP